jgi:hypothetical protein
MYFSVVPLKRTVLSDIYLFERKREGAGKFGKNDYKIAK